MLCSFCGCFDSLLCLFKQFHIYGKGLRCFCLIMKKFGSGITTKIPKLLNENTNIKPELLEPPIEATKNPMIYFLPYIYNLKLTFIPISSSLQKEYHSTTQFQLNIFKHILLDFYSEFTGFSCCESSCEYFGCSECCEQ